jgi:hypothetical protein
MATPTTYRVISDRYAQAECVGTLEELQRMCDDAGWTDENGDPIKTVLDLDAAGRVVDEDGEVVAVPLATIEIVGGGEGDEWADADHALDDAMRAADAEVEEYDQEQSGPIITRYRVVLTPELRELIESAPHARPA